MDADAVRPMDADLVRRTLLAWYEAHARRLPWRAPPGAESDPYQVWLSEVMLQQTRVETVRPRFGAWLARFPDIEALAAASEGDVLAAWSGLGYYRRARLLHAAARRIAADGLPVDRDGWRRLPGIGDYTAGAVASIVHGERVPAVDGNVVRVLARLAGVAEPVDEAQGRTLVDALAGRLVDPERPGDWNQALMDLGATVCLPRTPRCGACPLEGECQARAAGTQEIVPVKAARRRPVPEEHHFALLERAGRVWMVERTQGLLAGTWFLPGGGSREGLEGRVRQQTGGPVELAGQVAEASHTFTHRQWTMRVHAGSLSGEPSRGRWVDLDAPDVAVSSAVRKAVAAARAAPATVACA